MEIRLTRKSEARNDNWIGRLLFLCILFSLVPILITTLLIPNFNESPMYNVSVGAMFIVQIAIMLLFFFKHARQKMDVKLFLLGWSFMMCAAFTICMSALAGLKIDKLDIVNAIVRFVTLLLFICIPYYLQISKKELKVYMKGIVLLGFAACCYNMLINFRSMENIMNIENPYIVNFKSFFIGRNSFAQLLFFSIIANTFLVKNRSRLFYWLCYLVFGLNIFMSLSRTTTAAVCIFLFIFFLIQFRRKVFMQLSVLLSIGAAVIVVISNHAIGGFITNMLIRDHSGTSGRSTYWAYAFDHLLTKYNWLFGLGYLTGTNTLADLGYPNEFHNFYIETLVGGGAIDLVLHIIVFGVVLANIRIIRKHDEAYANLYISGLCALMFYGCFESVSFFSMGYVDSIFRIFFITIPLLYARGFKPKQPRSQSWPLKRTNNVRQIAEVQGITG